MNDTVSFEFFQCINDTKRDKKTEYHKGVPKRDWITRLRSIKSSIMPLDFPVQSGSNKVIL